MYFLYFCICFCILCVLNIGATHFHTLHHSKKRKKIKLEADATEANPLTREIYESTRSVVPFQHSGGATAALQTETETKLDARSLAEKNLELNEAGAGDGIYRGKVIIYFCRVLSVDYAGWLLHRASLDDKIVLTRKLCSYVSGWIQELYY